MDNRERELLEEEKTNALVEMAIAKKHVKQFTLAEQEMQALQQSTNAIKGKLDGKDTRSSGEREEDEKYLRRDQEQMSELGSTLIKIEQKVIEDSDRATDRRIKQEKEEQPTIVDA